jgi:hypothetical protein
MGYNRAGARAKQKERRRRKEERRLTQKAAAVEPQSATLVAKAKRAAKKAVAAVGGMVQTVKEKVTGKGKGGAKTEKEDARKDKGKPAKGQKV